VGVGAGLLVAGGVLSALALSDADDVSRLSDGPATEASLAEHSRLTDRGEERQGWSWVSYGVALGAIAGGLLWMALDNRGDAVSGTGTHVLRLDMEAQPGWTGVTLRGGF
jgi:hypothetical protein